MGTPGRCRDCKGSIWDLIPGTCKDFAGNIGVFCSGSFQKDPPLRPPLLDGVGFLLSLYLGDPASFREVLAANDNAISEAEGHALLRATAIP